MAPRPMRETLRSPSSVLFICRPTPCRWWPALSCRYDRGACPDAEVAARLSSARTWSPRKTCPSRGCSDPLHTCRCSAEATNWLRPIDTCPDHGAWWPWQRRLFFPEARGYLRCHGGLCSRAVASITVRTGSFGSARPSGRMTRGRRRPRIAWFAHDVWEAVSALDHRCLLTWCGRVLVREAAPDGELRARQRHSTTTTESSVRQGGARTVPSCRTHLPMPDHLSEWLPRGTCMESSLRRSRRN